MEDSNENYWKGVATLKLNKNENVSISHILMQQSYPADTINFDS